jgi:predicted nucleotidyltransferase
MKRYDEIRTILRRAMLYLTEQFGIREIGIFGSYIRDEAGPESDLDILVEFSRPIGWDIVELNEYLENLIDLRVDLVTKNSLHPAIRSRILEEVQYA